jgi:cell division transport system ATP-binding protein
VINFDNVTKVYPNQSRPALESVNIDGHQGRVRFPRRPVRVGEVDVPPAGPEGGAAFRRQDPRGRPGSRAPHELEGAVPATAIGCVFQDFRLLPNKNVYQNVAFAWRSSARTGAFIRKVVPEVIDLVGLEGKHDRMPDELSGGEQQRVAMARAFVNRPMILLADEPTGNIDPATSIGIMKVLDRINRTGTTVVMATHDAAIVDSMRKRVIELEYGKVVRDQSRGVYGQAY